MNAFIYRSPGRVDCVVRHLRLQHADVKNPPRPERDQPKRLRRERVETTESAVQEVPISRDERSAVNTVRRISDVGSGQAEKNQVGWVTAEETKDAQAEES